MDGTDSECHSFLNQRVSAYTLPRTKDQVRCCRFQISLRCLGHSDSNQRSLSLMKRLLRNRKTTMFFMSGEWTKDADLADTFDSVKQAEEAAQKYNLADVELVLRFD